jgi:hypothetical protein
LERDTFSEAELPPTGRAELCPTDWLFAIEIPCAARSQPKTFFAHERAAAIFDFTSATRSVPVEHRGQLGRGFG